MLDLKLLRTFREVAVRGSFSAAAEALAFTQPAVSQHIAKLEKAVGARLLGRDARGVALTPAGEVLLAHADSLLEGVRRAELDVLAAAGIDRPKLRVAAFPTVAAGLVPGAFKDLRETHPALDLQLNVLEQDPALDELQAGRIDLAMATESELVAAPERNGVVYHHIFDDQLLVALPIGHRLARQPAVALSDLADEQWFTTCLAGTCEDTNIVLRATADAGFEPNVTLRSDDYQAIQGMVASGMGVALIPALAGGSARHDLVVRPVAGRPPVRRIVAAVRAGESDPLVDRLIESLRGAGRTVPFGMGPRLVAA